MSNIEEDINILEKFNPGDEYTEKIKRAIENILLEQETDKKRIKELEEEREIVGMPVKNKRDERIGVVLHQWKNGSVAVLENINPQVINTHDSWSTLEIITDEVKQIQTKDDSIPKQKVKDKIEELKKEYEDSKDENGESEYYYPDYAIRKLEELLNDK